MARSLSKNRLKALQLQGGRCFYCGVLMWAENPEAFARAYALTSRLTRWLQCTAEHLQARQDGGRDSIKNIAAACRVCNHRRHAQRKIAPTPEDYRALVRKRVSRKAWHPPQVFERGLIAGD
jgi:5-methylcytosine-specific restriction endonuclease McrA